LRTLISETEPVIQQTKMPKDKNKKKNIGGRPLGPIWFHFKRKEAILSEKFGTKCKYCSIP